jgi:hypothetical protein
MSLIQKVNKIRQYIRGVINERTILSPLCIFVKTSTIN